MNFPGVSEWARASAATTLVDSCVIREPDQTIYDATTGGNVTVPGAATYTGPCSLGAPTLGQRSGVGADDRVVSVRILTLPGGTTGPAERHVVTVDGHPSMVIDRVQSRTTSHLARFRVVDPRDIEGNP